MPAGKTSENLILALLTLNFGATFLARNSLGYLIPFIRPELDLSNARIGLLSSGLALAWALSSLALSVAVRPGIARRSLLVALAMLTASASLCGAYAGSFALLLAARVATGLFSGPVLPIAQSIVTDVSAPSHRGLRMGILQTFGGALFGSLLAPLVLVPIAAERGWRAALLAAALISAAASVLLARFLALPETIEHVAPRAAARAGEAAFGAAVGNHNVRICSLIGVAMVAWLIVGLTFFPLYLVSALHATDAEMSRLMGVLGASSMVAAVLVPHLSDRHGRKPVMVIFTLVGMLLPLALLLAQGAGIALAFAMFGGALAGGTFPLFMATIPAESTPAGLAASSIGIVQAIAEIVGGVVAPFGAGWLSDDLGLRAALWLCMGCAAVAGLLAMTLKETAPRHVRPAIPS
jgi:ACS family hexuronate transporter-like MFS transporter